VPAAIMSIATANTFTRNIYRAFLNPACTDAQESQVAKIVSLVVKAGALVFIFALPLQFALYLQLLGGVWIIQTAPSVLLAMYARFLNGWALLIGWIVGFGLGTWMVVLNNWTPVWPLHLGSVTFPCYIAILSVIVNVLVSAVLSPLFNMGASGRPQDADAFEEDYA